MKGQLPKAYLRIDPNLDQTHPDPGAFVKLLCAAARQPKRGRFKTWAVLVAAVGKRSAVALRDRGDVKDGGSDAWMVDGWDIWQEGDMTVGERMRRYRNKHVTRPSPVTPETPLPPSEASGVKASNGSTTTPPNPLAPDRLSLERECLSLTREVAAFRNADPVEVMAEASEWKGSRGNMNPAAMSEGRLLNVVLNLRRMRDGRPKSAPSEKALARVDRIKRMALGGLDAGERQGMVGGDGGDGVHALGPGRDAGGDGLPREALRAGGEAEPDRPPVAVRGE